MPTAKKVNTFFPQAEELNKSEMGLSFIGSTPALSTRSEASGRYQSKPPPGKSTQRPSGLAPIVRLWRIAAFDIVSVQSLEVGSKR